MSLEGMTFILSYLIRPHSRVPIIHGKRVRDHSGDINSQLQGYGQSSYNMPTHPCLGGVGN